MKPTSGLVRPPLATAEKEKMLSSDAADQFVKQGRMSPSPTGSTSASVPTSTSWTASSKQSVPWLGADRRYKQSVMLKVPEYEYLIVKWLAETTYDASQNSIYLEAMREYVIPRLRERGFTVDRAADGSLIVTPPDAR